MDALKAVSTPMLDEVSSLWNTSDRQTEGLARELIGQINKYIEKNRIRAA